MLRVIKPFSIHFFIVTILLCVSVQPIFCQDLQYPAFTIPDSLKQDANAIVRICNERFVQNDLENATFTVTQVITVLNKKGDRFANFGVGCDKFHELRDFSGLLRDASGKVVKKIKKGDLTNSNIDFDAMATQHYSLTYKCQSPTYPFTVEYSYQVKYKNGILGYPSFYLYDGAGIAVEKSNFVIEVPTSVDLRYRENFSSNLIKTSEGNKTAYAIDIVGAKAIVNEKFMPPSEETYPSVFFAPNAFCYDGHCGDMSTWKSYGLWVADLLKDRDILSESEIAKLKAMTTSAKNDREKVKILYEYMQANTRYVSIQLGIGGFQPFEASSVIKSKYGDCKGLTNLMKAMLKAVDIPSNYCEIYSGNKKKMYSDFASISQTNHAILLVPLSNDSIWLECTSQTLPFAFVHDNIAGHDALVIAEDGSGGKLCPLPMYTDEQNKAATLLKITLDEDGTAKGNIVFENSAHQHRELSYYIETKDRDKQLKYINGEMKLPQMEVGEISTSEDFSGIPKSSIRADFVAKDYASKTGARLFVPVCPYVDRNYTSYFPSDKRNFDIDIDDGSTLVDSLVLTIPAGCVVESLPKETNLVTDFGTYISNASQDGDTILYVQQIVIPSGRYEKSKYKDLKDFLSKVTSASKRKIVLKKETN